MDQHESQTITDAQRALERSRAELEAQAPKPLAAVLGTPPPAPPGGWRCNLCKAAGLEYPGICELCGDRLEAQARTHRLKAWTASLPEMHRDVTPANALALRNHAGGPRVVGCPPQRLRALLEAWNRHGRVLLVGPAGCGKSTVAAALLRASVERDLETRARFVEASDLARGTAPDGGPTALEYALGADVVVLDDLGAELEGAQPNTGLLAQRVGPASRVIADRFARGRPLVVTTGIGHETRTLADLKAVLVSFYGDRIARRLVEEPAVVVRLGGAS